MVKVTGVHKIKIVVNITSMEVGANHFSYTRQLKSGWLEITFLAQINSLGGPPDLIRF